MNISSRTGTVVTHKVEGKLKDGMGRYLHILQSDVSGLYQYFEALLFNALMTWTLGTSVKWILLLGADEAEPDPVPGP